MASSPATTTSGPYVGQTRLFLDTVFSRYPDPRFAFRLWDGSIWTRAPDASPIFTIVLNHPGALRQMFLPPSDTRLALAYVHGHFDILGDRGSALNLGKHLWESWTWSDIAWSAIRLISLPRGEGADIGEKLDGAVGSLERDREAVQWHYDISNHFYALWLDRRMVYSCGYFRDVKESVDQAQWNKMEMLCRKLGLKKGDRVLDVGCGWGALVSYMGKYWDVDVLGITVSQKQLEGAKERVKNMGVEANVRVELMDWRQLEENNFDKIVSVGMIEHVGRANLEPYFQKMFALLKPGGVMLNHGITLLHDPFKSVREVRNGFFAKYIFPDGDVQPIGYVLERAVRVGFEIRDVESLREHYGKTLKCWLERFEKNEEEIVEMVGMKKFRLWRLYLLSAGWGFDKGLHSIYQTILYKAGESGSGWPDLPMTRDEWYTTEIPKDEEI